MTFFQICTQIFTQTYTRAATQTLSLKRTRAQIKGSLFFLWVSPLLALIISTSANAEEVCHTPLPDSEHYREALLYYPCNATSPLPALTLTGGYNNTYRNLLWMTEALTAEGYVVLTLTPNNINGNVEEWQTLHLYGQSLLRGDDNTLPQTLSEKIDIQHLGLAGFSMGGGGVLLAAAELGEQVQAVTAFAPFLLEQDRPKATPAAPALILAGDRDLLVTNESIDQIWQGVSDSAATSALVKYTNGRHQQWYRPEFPQNRESYLALTLAWLNLHLKADSASAEILRAYPQTAQEGLLSRFEYRP